MSAQARGQTVLVIGGGMGGLLSARKLVADGFDVTVVDKNERFGGCNARVDLDGKEVPAAFYSLLGLEPGSSLRRMLWPEGSCGDPPERMTIIDHVFLPEGDVALACDLDELHQQLRGLFPAEGDALDRLVAEIREVYDAIQTLFLPVTPPQRVQAMKVLRGYGSVHYREHLRGSVADLALRRLLSVRAFASTNTASTVLAYLAKGLLDGFYRLPGAGASAVDRLVEELAGNGSSCRLRPGQRVVRLLVEDGVVVGARTADGADLRADHVVLGIDVDQAVRTWIDTAAVQERLIRQIDGFAPGMSALTLIYALSPDMLSGLERFRKTARLVLLDVDDPFELLESREAGVLDAGMIKINVDLHDPEQPRLYAELDCSTHARWGGVELAAMAGREEQVLAPLVAQIGTRIERVLPGFGSAIRALRVLTPHTYQEMTSSRSGSGWRDDITMPMGLGRELTRLGVVLVGQWSMFGSGISQLEIGAQAALREIRRRAGQRGKRSTDSQA